MAMQSPRKTKAEELGEVIKYHRKHRDIDIRTASDMASCPEKTFRDFEDGKAVPDGRQWGKLCNLVNRALFSHRALWQAATSEVAAAVEAAKVTAEATKAAKVTKERPVAIEVPTTPPTGVFGQKLVAAITAKPTPERSSTGVDTMITMALEQSDEEARRLPPFNYAARPIPEPEPMLTPSDDPDAQEEIAPSSAEQERIEREYAKVVQRRINEQVEPAVVPDESKHPTAAASAAIRALPTGWREEKYVKAREDFARAFFRERPTAEVNDCRRAQNAKFNVATHRVRLAAIRDEERRLVQQETDEIVEDAVPEDLGPFGDGQPVSAMFPKAAEPSVPVSGTDINDALSTAAQLILDAVPGLATFTLTVDPNGQPHVAFTVREMRLVETSGSFKIPKKAT